MFGDSFQGKKVLVTGHTGFKGSWLCQWLLELGAEVSGISLPLGKDNQLYQALDLNQRVKSSSGIDVRDASKIYDEIDRVSPDFIFHLAAQPLVRKSYQEPLETFGTNVIGTLNVLDAVRQIQLPCTLVVVTTDKCYENKEWLHAYRETDPLGGHDPYSASKACTEIATHSYRKSFFSDFETIRLATARAGNVIGGGDWAEDRIVPDIVRAILEQKPIQVRNRFATRPWQHVLEPLSGYLWLAAELSKADSQKASALDAFNFGPELSANQSVETLVSEMLKHLTGTWEDKTDPSQPHEASLLNLSTEKAYHLLGWEPCWNFSEAIEQTAIWYRSVNEGAIAAALTQSQIHEFCDRAREKQQPWTF